MTQHGVKVLIIDEDAGFLEEAAAELSGHFTVYTSTTGGNGLKLFAQLRPQVVIVDAGISDIPFTGLLEDLKGLGGAILRIATSRNYSAMETLMQAIVTRHIHNFFRKPMNYLDLIGIINARTVSDEVGWSIPQDAGSGPAHEKLHTIVDKAKEVEKCRQHLEAQPAKIRDGDAECFIKVPEALEEIQILRKKVADKEALADALQAEVLELEELKKREIDQADRVVEIQQQRYKAELQALQDAHEEEKQRTVLEIERRKAEFDADCRIKLAEIEVDRKWVEQEVAKTEADRRQVEEELAREKDEAERTIALQKERNKAELQVRQDALKEEQQRTVWVEIDRLKIEFEKERQGKLAEIEADRRQMDQELAGMRTRMAEEKEQLEKSVQEQREKAEADISLFRESVEEEQKKLTLALEASLAVMKKTAEAEAEELRASATRELDRFRMTAQKKEHALSEALVQARRVAEETGDRLKLTENRIKILEAEIEKHIDEKDQILQALESLRADFKVAIQSREALLMEVVELHNRLG